MRVIVTRPPRQAEATCGKLASLGHQPVTLPLFEPTPLPSLAAHLLKDKPRMLAATSAEAIRTLSMIERIDPDILSLAFYVVGPATAAAARAIGFSNVIAGPGDGAGLADLVAAREEPREAHELLYLAGRPRAAQFERGLEARKIPYTLAEIYDMRPVPHPLEELQALLVEERADVVLLYSRLHAETFFALPVFENGLAALSRTLFICISAHVAGAVPEELQPRAVVALEPNEAAMLDLL